MIIYDSGVMLEKHLTPEFVLLAACCASRSHSGDAVFRDIKEFKEAMALNDPEIQEFAPANLLCLSVIPPGSDAIQK